MKPTEWNATMAGTGSYPIVAEEARAYLATCDGQISTTDLVNALYPPQHGDSDEGMKARRKLFAAVQHMASGVLSDCASRGPEKKVMGRIGRAWLWHASRGVSRDAVVLRDAESDPLLMAATLVSNALGTLLEDDEGELVMSPDMDPAAWDEFLIAWKALSDALTMQVHASIDARKRQDQSAAALSHIG